MTRRNVRVLVVEDDATVRRDVADVLDEEGFIVEEAAHGAEALDRVRRAPPDVVLLDLYLPLMDGWAFREALRKVVPDREPSIIVMSTDRYIGEEAKHLGARAVLPKPFDLDHLIALVARVSAGAA